MRINNGNINAYILAGGPSTRMNGYPKGLLEWNGRPLVQHIAKQIWPLTGNIYLNANHDDYHQTGIPVVPDSHAQGNGPLEGLITCLDHSDKPFNLMVACDMPYLTADFLGWFYRQLNPGMNALVPFWQGDVQPLCGFYHKNLLKSLQGFELQGILKLKQVLCEIHASAVTVYPHVPGYHEALFTNINSMVEYET